MLHILSGAASAGSDINKGAADIVVYAVDDAAVHAPDERRLIPPLRAQLLHPAIFKKGRCPDGRAAVDKIRNHKISHMPFLIPP